jgi:hypothetical protein
VDRVDGERDLADLVAGDALDRPRRGAYLDGHVARRDRLEPVGEHAHVVVAQVLQAREHAPHAHPQRERDPQRDAHREQRARDRRRDDQQPRRAGGGVEAVVRAADAVRVGGREHRQRLDDAVVISGEVADRVQRDDRGPEQEADDAPEREPKLATDAPTDAEKALHAP